MKKQAFYYGAAMLLALGVSASAGFAQNGNGNGVGNPEAGQPTIVPHGVNKTEGGAPTAGTTAALSPIINHGGGTMTTPKPYLIWYGNWNQSNNSDTPAGQQIVRDFLFGESNSPYFQINTTYNGPNGSIQPIAETTVSASGGTLNDNSIFNIVVNAIRNGALPLDPTGVYFVLTSSNIAKTGFCSQYCGWHTYGTVNGVVIQYSFVGNANRCLNACAAQTTSPNNNAGVDGMVSVIAHELEESTTDPHLNAWYDSSGAENADKCAWTFGGSQARLASGAYYNMTLPTASGSTRNYLIQRNLSATDNKCYVSISPKIQ